MRLGEVGGNVCGLQVVTVTCHNPQTRNHGYGFGWGHELTTRARTRDHP